MSKQQNRNEESFWIKLATFVVDKRNLFFLMTLIALVFSFFSRNWVEVKMIWPLFCRIHPKPVRRWISWTNSSSLMEPHGSW